MTMTILGFHKTRSVFVDGDELTPTTSLKIRYHSPDGFAWGYAGSGPSQLALAILLYAGIEPSEALLMYHEFKQEFIEHLPIDGNWRLDIDIWNWYARRAQLIES